MSPQKQVNLKGDRVRAWEEKVDGTRGVQDKMCKWVGWGKGSVRDRDVYWDASREV